MNEIEEIKNYLGSQDYGPAITQTFILKRDMKETLLTYISTLEERVKVLTSERDSAARWAIEYSDKLKKAEEKVRELESLQREQEEIVLGIGPITCHNDKIHDTAKIDDCLYCKLEQAESRLKNAEELQIQGK